MKTPTEPAPKGESDAAGVKRLVAEAADSLGELLADHIRLARLELEADALIYAGAAGWVIVAVLLAAIGYLLASVAAVLGLARLTGMPTASGLVAAFHLAVGAGCFHAASRRLRRTKVLRETTAEARRSKAAAAQTSERHVS
jgi:Putative Actinobacterial Holin-X, holin superfamily III